MLRSLAEKNRVNQQLFLLQVLRGVAAISVALSHGTHLFEDDYHFELFGGIFNLGSWGVDLFFVLSGFIIFHVHQNDIGNRQKLKGFITKRFLRIFPIYWIVTLLVLPLLFIAPSLSEQTSRGIGFILMSIILFPQEVHPIIGVAWTLTYELFFYAMFSLLILLPKKWSFPIIVSWIAAIIGFFIIGNWVNLDSLNYYLRFVFNPLCLEFIFGAMIAYFCRKFKQKIAMFAPIFLVIGLLGFTATWIISFKQIYVPHRVLSWGVFSAFLILGCVLIEGIRKFKVPRVLTYLGDASYSIYLIHVFSLSVFNKMNNIVFSRFSLIQGIMIVFLTIVTGCLCYTIVERPTLKFLRNRSKAATKTQPLVKGSF